MVTISRAEYERLQAQGGISALEKQVEQLMEAIRLSRKKQFGPSYEKLGEDAYEQLSLLFNETVKSLPKQEQAESTALEGQRCCSTLFALEKEFAGMTAEERYRQRQERARPILDALLAWAETKKAVPKSALGKVLHYLRKQWPWLIRYPEDGRLEISNNRAERSIKPFVMDRKNFLFANTPNGAQGSAIIFSMIKTAKENRLDPYHYYLVWVLRRAPVMAASGPGWAERLLPENAPEVCRVS